MIAQTIDQSKPIHTSPRQVEMEFLFLDLTTCTRCVGTHQNLETAIESLKHVLALTGVQVTVNKVLIDSPEKAVAHHFVTSPTLRINGRDIALETKESRCDSCTELCGCQEGTLCRVWLYQGQEYTEAPVAMIVEALLQEVYGTRPKPFEPAATYTQVPDNLQHFFAGRSQLIIPSPSACCAPETQATCCEPAEKSACCGQAAQTERCGCQ
ncbi:MAG: DUF2703 domain-containing protein [Anaerolineae bacterium]|nr:DUF2703 domain-containing protein [Anaerolineae bacterium]